MALLIITTTLDLPDITPSPVKELKATLFHYTLMADSRES